MEKKANKYNQKDKPTWDWTHVQCYLKTVQANRKSTIWNLAPSIILTNPSTDSSGPTVRLYIDTEKSLQYSNDLGWNWHKSWNIPNISLRLQIKDENTGDFLLSPRNLYTQIFAVKKNTQNQKTDRMTLIDVGIRGQSKMEMIDGQVYFSAIKFSSTTYNNEGINFNLLIVLYINQGEFQKPKVLTAVLSPPIFVDSRRSARDYQQKKFSSFVEPFAYDNLEKEFIKRQNKSKCQSEIVIKNDPEGFYNYITAPNIRHKVKHPVFLAIKFSNCVKIYYNTKLVATASINELLQNMQTKLLKENKSKQKTDVEIATNIEEKHFVFVISNLTDSLKRKKVLESIETMQNEFIGISCGPEELLDCLMPMGTVQSLKKGYKQTYESLITICQNYEPEYQEQSQDQYYSEGYEQSEKESAKNKKGEAARNTRNKTTIISNKNNVAPSEKPAKLQKNDEVILKKEELFDSQFQAPVFFNNQNQQNGRKGVPAASGFNRSVGFRNVSANPNENNPIFDTTQLNKNFANNLANVEFGQQNAANNQPGFGAEKNQGFKTTKTESNVILGQNNPPPPGINLNLPNNPLQNNGLGGGQPQGPNPSNPPSQNLGGNFNLGGMNGLGGNGFVNGMHDNFLYNNLGSNIGSNLGVSNWLNHLKSNNGNLFDRMQQNQNHPDQLLHKNTMERFMQNDQDQKMLELGRLPPPTDDQQSIVCLIQQVNLYKELLSQVTYQNQLLTRDITFKQQQQQMQGLNYLNAMNGMNINGLSNLGGIGSLPGMMNPISGVGPGLMGNGQYLSQDMLNGQLNLINSIMLQNRPPPPPTVDPASKDKEPIPFANPNPLVLPPNPIAQGLAQGLGTPVPPPSLAVSPNPVLAVPPVASVPASTKQSILAMGIPPQNYEFIKNMLLQDLKRQAELKERQKQQSSK